MTTPAGPGNASTTSTAETVAADPAPVQDETPRILVGPLLRHVDADSATVWVETSHPCTVRVRMADREVDEPTWGVHGHHYAMVHVEGLEPGHEYEYSVELDGRTAWPEDPDRPSVARTPADDGVTRLVLGSCRRGESRSRRAICEIGADALVAVAERMSRTPHDEWPDALLLLGDQVYADIPSKHIADKLERHRAAGGGPATARASAGARGDRDVSQEICDFEEYTWLYHESWRDPDVRWLLSTVPSCMIVDDHDLRDDWNSSYSWRQEMSAQDWWPDRVVGAFGSYLVYQHLGNLSPRELAEHPTYQALRAAGSDAEREQLLADFALRADGEPGATQWSFHRDFGRVRVVMLDVRASRSLDPDRRRIMDDAEWEWTRRSCLDADVDHLLIGSSLPAFMLPALHHLEGWNEAVAQRADRMPRRARLHEWVRRAVDLEHWAAFRSSFDDLMDLLRRVSAGEGAGERPPASILLLGGDVHCSYLEEVDLGGGLSAVHQLVMSPFRNPLQKSIRVVNRVATRPAVVRTVARLAARRGVRTPQVSWAITDGIWFDNGAMTVVLRDRAAHVEVDHAMLESRGRGREPRQVLRRTRSKELA